MKYKVTCPEFWYEEAFDNFKDAYLSAIDFIITIGVVDIDFLRNNYPPEVEKFIEENGKYEFYDRVCIELIDSETEPIYISEGVEMLCRMFDEIMKENS